MSSGLMRTVLAVGALAILSGGCMSRSDSLAPIVSIFEPSGGIAQTAENMRVRGYAMDDKGIEAIRVNGADLLDHPAYEAERGKRLIEFGFRPLSATEGENSNTIEVEDVNGHVSTLLLSLRLDATPPTIEIIQAQAIDEDRIRVSGIARDNTHVASVIINGEPLHFEQSSEVSFELVVPRLQGGAVEVEDSAGNVTRHALP